MCFKEEATVDLSLNARRARRIRPVQPAEKLSRPRDVNYWTIPTAFLSCVALWVLAAAHLRDHHNNPMTGWTLILVTAAATASGTTVLYVAHYLSRRSVHQDHQVLLDEMTAVRGYLSELRSRTVVAAAEQRTLLEEINKRLGERNDAYWMAYAETARRELIGDGAEVLPFGRRSGA